jgi:hypothetical protein
VSVVSGWQVCGPPGPVPSRLPHTVRPGWQWPQTPPQWSLPQVLSAQLGAQPERFCAATTSLVDSARPNIWGEYNSPRSLRRWARGGAQPASQPASEHASTHACAQQLHSIETTSTAIHKPGLVLIWHGGASLQTLCPRHVLRPYSQAVVLPESAAKVTKSKG